MKETEQKFGVVVGRGDLPRQLKEAFQKRKTNHFFLGLKGIATPSICDKMLEVGKLGTAISIFKKEKITDLIFIGGLSRPALDEIKPDWTGWVFLLKNAFKIKGDNSLLSALMNRFEKEGFKIRGIHEVIPEIITQKKCYTKTKPTLVQKKSIEYGQTLAQKLGEMDIGQSVVVQGNLCLGLEAIEGTDSLIMRCSKLARGKKNKPILIKACKPNQDKRIDLPTIGYLTVKKAIEGGYAGIGIQSKNALFTESEQAVALANKNKFFILGW